jgi:hypothetical protein
MNRVISDAGWSKLSLSVRSHKGHKWFSRFPANEILRRTGLHLSLSVKLSFYLPAYEISRSCRTASGFAERDKSRMSETLIGWKSVKTSYFPTGPNGGSAASASEFGLRCRHLLLLHKDTEYLNICRAPQRTNDLVIVQMRC